MHKTTKKDKFFQFCKKYKTYIICIIIIILSIISVIFQYVQKNNQMKVNLNKIENKEDKIAVYINGAVKNPGVYYLNQNSRLYELLDICGGVTDSADINNINLAKRLVDSDMITISEKKLEDLNEEKSEDYFDDDNANEKININTASKEELMTLSGVGEQTANKIIEYRKNIRFNEIEDLMNVNGVGKSKFESIKNYICVD